jgi:hypothetical protein
LASDLNRYSPPEGATDYVKFNYAGSGNGGQYVFSISTDVPRAVARCRRSMAPKIGTKPSQMSSAFSCHSQPLVIRRTSAMQCYDWLAPPAAELRKCQQRVIICKHRIVSLIMPRWMSQFVNASSQAYSQRP